ncbi:MAG: hypothetical protein AB2724_10950 [Candidatus Thiodiazotropha sp.]
MWEFVTAVIVAALTGYITFRIQEERLKKELKTEFMAEKVAKDLLSNEKWEKRTFEAIKKRLGGFDDNELRKILVRAGAVRFEGSNGEELWGLISRNESAL